MASDDHAEMTVQERLDALRATKLAHTREKQRVIGAMDHDDWGTILPPEQARELVRAVSGSGVEINDVILKDFRPRPTHPGGGFFGPAAVGANFRALLAAHPVYLDPLGSLAGAGMVNFNSYKKVGWNPDLPYPHAEEQRFYQVGGIGAQQHFCQDLQIGLDLGWGGLLEKIDRCRPLHPEAEGFYRGLEEIVRGMQEWMGRHAAEARAQAEAPTPAPADGRCPLPQREGTGETEGDHSGSHHRAATKLPPLPEWQRQNLLEIAEMNERLMTEAPRTFREACQWILWHLLAAFMFNGSGSLGRLDVLLLPYYERERAAGTLSDEQAILHIAGILLREAAYIQLGGPRADGSDATNPVSFLVLEAAHRLKIPSNVGVCVGPSTDPRLFRRSVEILLEDRLGLPKFLGVDNTLAGFMKNGYPAELARERAYSGCHWSALPGREYCLNDCIKVNFARIWEIAVAEGGAPPVEELWARFERHMGRAVEAAIRGMEFHLEHSHECFPELVISLLCHGTLEQGRDASHWGVEFTNICVDGAALATVADSFAAVEQRVEREGRMTWEELRGHLARNWEGTEGEQARLMMRTVPRYGSGGSRADEWARRIAETFTRLVVATPTPGPFKMIPGLFSWAATIPMGREIGATPNGRRAGEPISHGSNPDPGFRQDGAPTALAVAVAAVQPGYGNTAPLQIELDPLTASGEQSTQMVQDLLQAHFDLGGTQVNINVLDKAHLLEAHDDPSKYPDLVVRVTGFSAYFASLSPEFRRLVVERVVAAA